ncbi:MULTISPECIES: hypothetical protein [Paenibacillus]|uniref:Uncharacterized protein n=1 Tax=Paenibacillus pabuli TaxID=1472 RepID=A0A855XXA0_9BACL|nr:MULTISPECIES: hypothetical protein [Paenibacillus]PWW42344.1 hypothetical protein DET56_104403 [Paenibacillus pabuli]PXW07732.1 hypothetical protein DEU73_105402 [Paenibacillus taichungensis]RAI94506.1 hypothetical protein DET54_10741 [Paenibacillus pabuli]
MKFIIMVFMIAIIAGCGEKIDGDQMMSTGDILAKEMIQKDPSADLFLFNDRVYIRKEEIKDIDHLGEMLGEIKSNYAKEGEFKDLMSTKLLAGTEIYRFNNENSMDQVIVKENGKLIIYDALTEG